MKFKLLPKTGNHSEKDKKGKVRIYNSEDGEIINSETNLAKAFPLKFEEVTVGATLAIKKEKEPKTPDEDEDTQDDPPKPNPLGKDVTKRFPEALDEDILVFSDGGAFSVVEADAQETPLHEKPLKKAQVAPFIKKYLEE